MLNLSNRRILLGITGGIAAYKSAELARLLKKAGADVRVVMTKSAIEFITPLSLQALSGHPVSHQLLDTEAEAGMGHIELAKWADLIIIAPASADFIAKLAKGQADDLLSCLCLATKAPICTAPAMNQAMWSNTATQRNIDALKQSNIKLFGPAEGEQACGDVGPGRMLEPNQIVELLAQQFSSRILAGVQLSITAGPTREAIDPVRYISNYSSGKMGYALASAAVDAGAKVNLISGPVNLDAPERVNLIQVNSALEMLDAAQSTQADIFIGCAAVADYRPAQIAKEKIKSSSTEMQIELIKNPDIIASIAQQENKPFMVGFAAETEQMLEHARAKLERKHLDIILANNVADTSIGFNAEDNAVTLISATQEVNIGPCSKRQLAQQLIATIAEQYKVLN